MLPRCSGSSWVSGFCGSKGLLKLKTWAHVSGGFRAADLVFRILGVESRG